MRLIEVEAVKAVDWGFEFAVGSSTVPFASGPAGSELGVSDM